MAQYGQIWLSDGLWLGSGGFEGLGAGEGLEGVKGGPKGPIQNSFLLMNWLFGVAKSALYV